MRAATWSRRARVLGLIAFACGGGGDTNAPIDAPVEVDAAIDAPPGVDAQPDLDAPGADAGATPPDTCGEVAEIVLDGSGLGTATGSFGQVAHDYTPAATCGAQEAAPDAVYAVTLPGGLHDVTIDTFGSSANTVLGLGFECSVSGLGSVCNDDADAVGPSRMWLHRVQGPVQFFVLVDSASSGESGSFQVNVQRRPAAPAACPSAVGAPPLDITGGGTVVGVQPSTVGVQRGSCMPGSDTFGEAVFRWTASASGTSTFTARSFDFSPDVYVRATGCSAGTEVGCVLGVGDTSTVDVITSAATTYFTFVDGGLGVYSLHFQP